MSPDSGRYDLVVIGSGPAGERAALMAAGAGRRVAIVERCPHPGGAMVNTGTIASKVLRETALLCSALRRRPLPGVRGEFEGQLSFRRLLARTTLVRLEEHDRIERSIDRAGIDVLRGHGRIAGERMIEVRGADGLLLELRTEHLLLAPGSRPHRPDIVDFSSPAIVDADGILELDRMPRSLVVVGGGVIGCEYACIFAELGVETTLLEPRDALLPFLDAEIRSVLAERMRDLGISIRFNAAVASARPHADGGAHVVRRDGSEHRSDLVLWALGRSGNTEDLGLERVGLVPDARGLLAVDADFRTSVPWIWAAGDVIGFPALASTGQEQGRLAAVRMFDLPRPGPGRPSALVPMGIYTIPAIGAVGITEEEARAKGIATLVGRARYRNNPRGRMLGDDTGLCKLVFAEEDGRLLGASIVGEDATELVHLAQTAMALGAGLDYFVDACFTYPSLGDLLKYAAIDARRRSSEVRRAA